MAINYPNAIPFDSITSVLTTSRAAYAAAAVGAWVKVTGIEYDTLAAVLSAVKVGVNDGTLTFSNAGAVSAACSLSQPALGSPQFSAYFPANGYLVGFALNSKGAGAAGTRVKISNNTTNGSAGYANIGAALEATVAGVNYWLRKTPATTDGGTAGFLGVYHPTINNVGNANGSSTGTYFAVGDTLSMPTAWNPTNYVQIQGLATTVKRW